jgi:hypothetical protein
MNFWHFWEQGFQAFMVIIGVSLIWLRFIEPLFASRRLSVILMIIIAFALAAVVMYLGLRDIQKKLRAAQAQIDATLAKSEAEE